MDPTWINAVAAAVIALATVAIVGVYIGQWRTMAGQLMVTKDAAKRAEIATHASARAYFAVQPDSIEMTPIPPQSGSEWRLQYKLTNFGDTPGSIDRLITAIRVLPMPKTGPILPADPKAFWAGCQDDIGIDRIEAKNYVTRYFTAAPLTEPQLAGILRRHEFICVAIRIRYTDVFGETEQYGLAAGYDPGERRFLVIPEDQYTYQRKYKPDQDDR